MTPDIQPSEEQKKEFFKALEDFQQSKGLELRYQEILKNNKNLENYFKELIESAIYSDELDFVGLLLSEDPEVSKIKIDNKSILFLLIRNFNGDETAVIISNHIKKFDSIGEDKDDGDNLIVSLFSAGDNQEVHIENPVKKIIEALVANGVSVNDKNNLGTTPLDLCWNFEIFKTLAQHASQETLEKKLRYIVENEDLASEDAINITKFLLIEKNVKIDGFFDWKWPEIPIYQKAIFAQIILDHGNDEQKKCLTDYNKSVENSPFFAIIDDDTRFYSEPLNFREEIKKDRIAMAIILNKKEALEKIISDNPKILEEAVKSNLTPVFYAIDRGKLNALEAIISAGPEVLDQKSKNGLTPVFHAIKEGNVDALEKIISTEPEVLDQKSKNGFTPVLYAIKEGNVDALEKIISASTEVLDRKDENGLTPVFHAIWFDKLDALEKIIKARSAVLDQKSKNGFTPVLYAINKGKLDALKKIISDRPEVLDQKSKNGLTPVFHAIKEGNVDALEKIISASTEVLDRKDENGLTPVFHAIWFDKFDALEKIIKARSAVLDQKSKNGFTPVLYAIKEGNVDALEKIISASTEVLDRKDENGLTPVFHAIWLDKLDALEKIIKARSAVLDQKDKSGLTPVFYAIDRGKLDALKKILETSEGALEQKNQQGENPILYSLKSYSDNSSDDNKEILKFIFQKQFGRNLQDEEIKNLVEFVNNYNFLKLFYNEYGQGMDDIEFKSIVSSILPSEEELESELSKNLLKICQTIAQAKEKPSIIECHDASEDKTELHIHYSRLNKHASYFIFHVNAQNKLTKISYCDGHDVFSERIIIEQIGRDQSPYIYGATTFELKESMDFSPQFAEDFVNKNSKGKSTIEFRLQHFSRAKLESKEIFGCKFLGMTHSIPTKMQSRGNCSLKSFYVASRHLLEIQHQIENSTTDRLFTYDEVLKAQGGEGYKSYKDLRQKMVDKAGEKLFESGKNLEKNFLDSIEFFEKMNSLMDRSSMKEKKAKPKKSTTKLLQTRPDLIDQINRNKLFKDNLVLDEVNHQKHFNLIATSHLNLSQEDVDKIKFLFEKQEVKIDNFLDWNFQTTQAKNNFIKLVFEHGDEGKKESFNLQLSASNPEKRDKFFKDLSKESLSLILTAFEKQKSKFGNLEQIIEVIKTKQRKDPHGLEDFMSDPDFFKHRDAKNNFVKEIESRSSEERKDAFIIKFCSDKSEENRNKFLNGLDPQCLSFMLRHSQAQLGKLKNVEKIIEELRDHIQKIENESINFGSVRVGDKRVREEEGAESVVSKKTLPSPSIYSAGGSTASSEKMEVTSSK